MTKPVTYFWSIPSANAIATLQNAPTAVGPSALVLNYQNLMPSDGQGAQLPTSGITGSYDFSGVHRTVSITSTQNLSTVTYTVTGTIFGIPFSETINGPNNTTVETTNAFGSVTSVVQSTGIAASTVSVGYGTKGQTNWFQYNPYTSFPSLSITADITGTINYSVSATQYELIGNNVRPMVVPVFAPITAMNNATTDQFTTYTGQLRYICAYINSSGGDGQLVFTLGQQGV